MTYAQIFERGNPEPLSVRYGALENGDNIWERIAYYAWWLANHYNIRTYIKIN